MTDGQEEAVDGDIKQFLLVGTLEAHQMGAFHAVVTEEAHRVGIEQDLDLLVILDALLHGLAGAQIVFAHDQVDLVGQVAQIVGLLTGGVATTHHGNHLLAVEEAVAGGAGRYALTGILGLVRQAQILGRGTRGHDDGVGRELLTAVEGHHEGALAHIDASHEARLHLRAQVHSLLAHVIHQLESVDTLRETREILDSRSLGQLATYLQAFDEQAVDSRAHQIDGCGVAGRARADD